MPYPHQNLGLVAESIADGPTFVAAVSRLAGMAPAPAIRSFGPFAVPPSREIVACSDLDGERFVLMARVYPTLATLARLSGRLASNPWLAGGEVREAEGKRDEVEEKVLRVSWREGYWIVGTGRRLKFRRSPPAPPRRRCLPAWGCSASTARPGSCRPGTTGWRGCPETGREWTWR